MTKGVKPLKLKHRIGAALAVFFIRVLSWTVRVRVVDWGDAREAIEKGPVIFCVWHNRLSMVIPIYQKVIHPLRPSGRMAALISASRDGGLLARVLDGFGVRSVRGSSSRRGAQALLEATRLTKDGWDLTVTPDGPRGPCYSMKPGVLAIAAATGQPIVPGCYRLSSKITLKSWDRFQIPIPGSRCDITLGKTFKIPANTQIEADAPIVEELRKELLRVTPQEEVNGTH